MKNSEVSNVKVEFTLADGSKFEPTDWQRILLSHDKTYYKVIGLNGEAQVYPIVAQDDAAPILFGCMFAESDITTQMNLLKAAGLNLMRMQVFFGNNPVSGALDQALEAGFNVAVNFNYLPTATPVLFPTDSKMITNAAEAFFDHYAKWLNQIPCVVIENEWDNPNYRKNIVIDDYVNELSIITDIAHKKGFKIADAGITSNALRAWYFTELSGAAAAAWEQKYFTGKGNPNFAASIKMINDYIIKGGNVPFDYSNVHWYNTNVCNNGFAECATAYMHACDKSLLITNEFGVRSSEDGLFAATVAEIKAASPAIMVAYSGTNEPGKAIALTPDLLKTMQ